MHNIFFLIFYTKFFMLSTTLKAHRGNYFVSKGILLNYNTIESFKQRDKKILLKDQSQRIYKELVNQQCLANSTDILKFFVISFSVIL